MNNTTIQSYLTKIGLILEEQQPFKEALSSACIDKNPARTSAGAPLFASANLAAFSDKYLA